MMEASLPPDQQAPFRWELLDLISFAFFFVLVLLFLPLGAVLFFSLFQPDVHFEALNGIELISIQAAMDIFLVGFIIFLIRRLHGQPVRETLRWISGGDISAGQLAAGGAVMAVTVLILTSFFPEPGESPIERLLTTKLSITVFVIFGIAIAPLLEEVIFRGFLFPVLSDIFGLRVALPVTALLFAGLHVSQLRGNWPAVIVIFLVGFVLTVVRQRTNSLIPSVIMHTSYNAMIFAASALALALGESTPG